MAGIVKKLLFGASVVASVSAIAPAPSFAYSITGNNDVLLYDVCPGNNTCLTNDTSRLNAILEGNSSSPGGNVELFASSEQIGLQSFLQSTARTSITGTVAGQSLTLSSLTAADWFGPSLNTAYSANTFATTWFNAFYDAAGLAASEGAIKAALGLPSFIPSAAIRQAAYSAFLGDQVKGFQRSSDPNISYITTSGSDLKIGLAGHFDAKAYYAPILGSYGQFIKDGFQVSEVVKVNYGGVEQFLYGFEATQSGLVNGAGPGADYKSHSGNYEVTIAGVKQSVPEPSTMLGLMAVGGLFVAKGKLKKAA